MPSADELLSALQFVVYATNLQPLFENVDVAGTGSLTKDEFGMCAEQFEIADAEQGFAAMRAFINDKLGIALPADAVPFDLFCYYLSREKQFFDVEVETDEVAVPEGGDANASMNGSFTVEKRRWVPVDPASVDLGHLELPPSNDSIDALFAFVASKDGVKELTEAQLLAAAVELWPGFANVGAVHSAFASVAADGRVARARFSRALQFIVYANNLGEMFDETDAAGNKVVSRKEFVSVAEKIGVEGAAAKFDAMSQDGRVSFDAFVQWIVSIKDQVNDEVDEM